MGDDLVGFDKRVIDDYDDIMALWPNLRRCATLLRTPTCQAALNLLLVYDLCGFRPFKLLFRRYGKYRRPSQSSTESASPPQRRYSMSALHGRGKRRAHIGCCRTGAGCMRRDVS